MTMFQQTIYSIVVSYISVCVMLFLPFYLLDCKGKKVVLTYWGTTILGFLVMEIIRYYIFHPLWLILTLIMIVYCILVFVLFRDRVGRKTAVCVAQLMLLLTGEIITYSLLKKMGILWDFRLRMQDTTVHQGTVIANMVSYMLNMYFIVFWKVVMERERKRSYFLYIIIPLYQTVLLVIFLSQAEVFDWDVAMLGVALLTIGIAVNMVTIYLYHNLEQKAEIEEELTILYQQRQNELNYYRMTEQYIEQMREIRHEFVNQIQTAYLMIQKGGDTELARQLLSDSYERLQNVKLMQYCENPVVNALISAKEQKASANHITFKAKCKTEDIHQMDEIDICSLFGNLLDNAVEACLRMPQDSMRIIELGMWKKGGYQIIQVSNTYQQEHNGLELFETSKKDVLNHGYGIKLIEKICLKYSGELRTQITEERVIVTVYLKINQ